MKKCVNRLVIFTVVLTGALQVVAASRFDASRQPLGAVAPLVLSATNLSAGGIKGYRPWFENGSWQGDIVEYSVSSEGGLSTSVELGGTSPTNEGNNPANWSAHVQFALAENGDANYWDTGREIVTWNGSSQVAFRWSASTIGETNMGLIDWVALDAEAASSDILNYARGQRTREFPHTSALRARGSVLGDIIHSKPMYVAAPIGTRADNNYANWAAARIDRAARIYVGANDGMLHAFDADTGNEVYAYIPSMLMAKLDQLVARPYAHTYFVDGKLTVRDAYFNSSWHSVLVGGLGAGGRGYFALDITDPNLDNEAASSGSDMKVLWEIDASGDDDLGDSFSRALIAQFNDGNWYAVFGNGYNSVNGVAILYIVNIRTGAIVKKLATSLGAAGSPGAPNGLSTPTLLDSNKDGMVDYAYAGDIDGNLWKFDLTADNSNGWSVAYDRPLHSGAGGQPITMAPEITLHQEKGYMVFFGTGRLFTSADIADTTAQAMYGIWDRGSAPPSRIDQSLLVQNLDDPKTYTDGEVSESIAVYNADAGSVNWSTQDGWTVPLPAGYRVLEAVHLRASRVKGIIHNPATSSNFILESAIHDGGPHPTPIYDLNANGALGVDDKFDGNDDGDLLDPEDIPMAWGKPDGIMSEVTIARVSSGVDTMLLNYLVPPATEACEGDCAGGFQVGHIDVDTWHDNETYGGKSTQHTHEYDKETGRVYVDYNDINAGGKAENHIEIDDGSDIPIDEPFVVLVANADFSPGSTMRIGNKTWNVVEYQREIHIALKNWDATDPDDKPEDSQGASLVFTRQDVEAGGGTISHSFNDLAIRAGGLHPTQTDCVKDTAYTTFDANTLIGRFRNGALVTQLVKASHFTSSSAIEDVDVQRPTDLPESVTIFDGTTFPMFKDFDTDTVIEIANHERFGGLIAKSGTEHIWESTLFWHFGKLYEAVYGGKPCYGSTNWAAAVRLEQNDNAVADALAALNFDGGIEGEMAANLWCADENKYGGDNSCKSYYNDLVKLYELLAQYDPDPRDPRRGDRDLDDGSDAPHVMGGGTEGLGVVAGPGFEYGRLGWTDLMPK
jgi:hypothetical protein